MFKLTVAALAAALLPGCATAQQIAHQVADSSVAPTTSLVPTNDRPICEAAIVVVIDSETTACNVNPPTRLDVRFPGSDGIEQADFQARCDHMGGTLAWSDEFVCQGVDY